MGREDTVHDFGELKERPNKPPLGVMPKFIWLEHRVKDLQRAIKDYTDAGLAICPDWVDEYNQHVSELRTLYKVGRSDPTGLD